LNNEDKKEYRIKINPKGIFGKPNMIQEGCVFFGLIDERKSKENCDIDYLIPFILNNSNDYVINEKILGRHFQIEHKNDENKYFLLDLGIGFGTFVKIDTPIILKDNHLINIGETFIVVNIMDGNNNIQNINNEKLSVQKYNKLQLRLKVFGINNNGEIYFFPYNINSITMGRNKTCNLQILDKLLSKCHCTIKFNESEGFWVLYDGTINNPSTNGSWLYANEYIEIYDKMIFKTNQTTFQCFFNNDK